MPAGYIAGSRYRYSYKKEFTQIHITTNRIIFTANLACIPDINIPIGKDTNGLPIGMQILETQFDELSLLQTSHFVIEEIFKTIFSII